MKKTGFYIIKDQFFEDMSDLYLKGNKAGTGRIDKYKQILEKKEKAGKAHF